MGMVIDIGVWLEKSLQSGWIWWVFILAESSWRKTRSRTEFESWLLSKYLVGKYLVELEISSCKESMILKRMSL